MTTAHAEQWRGFLQAEVARLTAINAQLLEALTELIWYVQAIPRDNVKIDGACEEAETAIAAAKEG